jgi:hypothetical protein
MSAPRESFTEGQSGSETLVSKLDSLFVAANMAIGSTYPENCSYVMSLSFDPEGTMQRLKVTNWDAKAIVKIYRGTGEPSLFENATFFPDTAQDRPMLYKASIKDMCGRALFGFGDNDDPELQPTGRVHYEIFSEGVICYWRATTDRKTIVCTDSISHPESRSLLEAMLTKALPLDSVQSLADTALSTLLQTD